MTDMSYIIMEKNLNSLQGFGTLEPIPIQLEPHGLILLFILNLMRPNLIVLERELLLVLLEKQA